MRKRTKEKLAGYKQVAELRKLQAKHKDTIIETLLLQVADDKELAAVARGLLAAATQYTLEEFTLTESGRKGYRLTLAAQIVLDRQHATKVEEAATR